jgi:hypothetical protein
MSPMLLLCSALSAATASEPFNNNVYYFGDLHAHTGVSTDGWAGDGGDTIWQGVDANCLTEPDRCGDLETVFQTAVDNHLDFVALTDHDTLSHSPDPVDSSPFNYDILLHSVLSARDTDGPENPPAGLVVIPSMELNYETRSGGSVTAEYGHKNLYVFAEDDALLEIAALSGAPLTHDILADNQTVTDCTADIWNNVEYLSGTLGLPSLLWAHHPTATNNQTTDWSCHETLGDTYEPVVEIYSGYGNALYLTHPYDLVDQPEDMVFTDADAADATVVAALTGITGRDPIKVGFVGGTDLHDTRPGQVCDTLTRSSTSTEHQYGGGLTMVVLDDDEDLTRTLIHRELTAKRTLVTSGPRIPVEVTWDLAGGQHRKIGTDNFVPNNTTTTTLKVRVPLDFDDYIDTVTAFGPDDSTEPQPYLVTSKTTSGLFTTWSYTFTNNVMPAWLYVEVKIAGNHASQYYTAEGPAGCTVHDGGANNDEYIWASPTWFHH